ncbi:nucleotidyltransferase family protein [Paenibacillus sp. FSL K6-1096]|uniref:nucleotidyltransferase family protein n=1 Tax=Paenibacillus sp. FSL K6-1096 TaxID=2921460 RepID=UPI0030EE56DD
MIALILAAGYATRLYPLTIDTPKPLLPVQGERTILDLLVARLELLEDIAEILIVTNERFFPAFEAWARKSGRRKPVRILNDGTTSPEERLGAIGDIQFVLERERVEDDLLVLAGDNVLGFGLEGYLDYFRKMNTDCILVRTVDDPAELRRIGVAELDAQMRVVSLEEKPPQPRSNIGVFALYIYKRSTLPLFSRYLAEGGNPDAPTYFPEWLHSRRELRAYYTDGTIEDVGTPEAYEQMRARLEGQAE